MPEHIHSALRGTVKSAAWMPFDLLDLSTYIQTRKALQPIRRDTGVYQRGG